MKAPKTEIYHVIFNSKYKQPDGTPIVYEYTVGQGYDVLNKSIIPLKITILGERIKITFEDGGSHELDLKGCEIFRRPIVAKEETKTE